MVCAAAPPTAHEWAGRGTSGMLVRVCGRRRGSGRDGTTEWHLTATRNRGPEIPCLPAVIVTRKLLDGVLGGAGACACAGMLQLDDFSEEFEARGITWRVEEVE